MGILRGLFCSALFAFVFCAAGLQTGPNGTTPAGAASINPRWKAFTLVAQREAAAVARKAGGWWESTPARVLLATLAALKVVDLVAMAMKRLE